MGKLPAFQFYPGDWIQDTRILTPATRGIWIDILCFMWRSETRGQVAGTVSQLSRLLSCSEDEIKSSLQELNDTKCADVTIGNGECNAVVTIQNRRMMREEKERESTRYRVKRFRNADVKRERNAGSNANVTVPSSSSSSSSCTKVHKKKAVVSIKIPEKINPETWASYLEMRQQIKKPAGIKAQELIIKKLLKMGGDINAILEQSIMNSWQGVFELKTGGNGNGKNASGRYPYADSGNNKPAYRGSGRQPAELSEDILADIAEANRLAAAKAAADKRGKDAG
jgi:uncharacterized protein YdaU (DUF1376 family)